MLKINNLSVHYGRIHALHGITIDIPENKIMTLIGANGTGKSTTLLSIIGLVKSSGSGGTITYDNKEITGLPTKTIVDRGLVLVPEGRRLFPNLIIEENLILGSYMRKDKQAIEIDKRHVFELFPRLKERRNQKIDTLSGGEQQMLAVGRAIMSKPRLIMMDEPSLGLAPLIVKNIFNIIREIKNSEVNILLVEQNAKAALEIAYYGYVLEVGNIMLGGKGKELLDDDRVRKSYLGE